MINVSLQSQAIQGQQMIVVGYGTQQKKNLTAAISSVSSDDIKNVHAGATVSTSLAGKISGLSFRQSEGRPGASAGIQIRNMGTPLYVIDGVEEDQGQFNNLSPNDIASISVLKDASAAIYGVRAANGVVVVTTKQGHLDTKPTVNIDTYIGWQNFTRYPNTTVTAYQWEKYAAEAQMNEYGSTNITPQELAKWKQGGQGYQSFNWADFIDNKNAPQSSVNFNVTGGSKTTNYYLSLTRLNQNAEFREYNFNRTNIQSNITSKIGDNLKVGINVNGRIEERIHPGVPGGDDYWEPLFSVMRNRPTSQPFANDNPKYLSDIGHDAENGGLWTFANSGKYQNDWRVLQTNLHAQYDFPLKGLSAKGLFSYYYANDYFTNHEFTYNAYTYSPSDSTYNRTGGSTNPWQERGQELITQTNLQGQLNYDNTFGKNTIGATFVTELYQRKDLYNWLHDVPAVNQLNIIRESTIDTYNDSNTPQGRVSYVGRVTYNYADTYYLEVAGREDASWEWPPNHRWGFFPSVSVGWRLTNEPFFTSLIGANSILSDLKLRASWGKLGSDVDQNGNQITDPFGYISGYNYGVGTVILNGQAVNSSQDRGEPVTNITWLISHTTDIGADFALWHGQVSGSIDYFYRKRTGLLGSASNVIIPNEVGYSLPLENLNSDAQMGGEFSISYQNQIGDFSYKLGGNVNYSRAMTLVTKFAKFGNSWDNYRNSPENRLAGIFWGYQVIGQFKSQKQINNYPVNIDGQGNKTLLPGDLIYKDVNGDGVINQYDERPIGYGSGQPDFYGGINIALKWRGLDFTADFSYDGMYSFNRNWESRWPFQNGGALLDQYTNSWHRANPYDLNSQWIPGKYPALRFNDSQHSDYNKNSTFWLINVRDFRVRTLEVGYTLPKKLTNRYKMGRIRIYLDTYNLFSIDNMPSYLDPAVASNNGLQYPQNKYVDVGINLTF